RRGGPAAPVGAAHGAGARARPPRPGRRPGARATARSPSAHDWGHPRGDAAARCLPGSDRGAGKRPQPPQPAGRRRRGDRAARARAAQRTRDDAGPSCRGRPVPHRPARACAGSAHHGQDRRRADGGRRDLRGHQAGRGGGSVLWSGPRILGQARRAHTTDAVQTTKGKRFVFNNLSDRITASLKGLRGHGRLTEADVDKTIREIRRALLDADVAVPVVREFTGRVRERALGEEVSKALNPAQQVVKIVNDELVEVLGGATGDLHFAKNPPTVIMLAGLQGAGKTTLAGKLAKWMKSEGHTPLLVAADLQRPNAVNQLQVVG